MMYVHCFCLYSFFFFKQKTAYELRISDWSSDVCSSDLWDAGAGGPWVCNVYVPPHARGQGIAGLLCRHLERHAAGLGFAALHLASTAGDGSLYYRLGYRTYRTVRHGEETFHLMKQALPTPAQP